MERRGSKLHAGAAALAVLASGCGGETLVNAAWPTLSEQKLAFLVEVKARVRSQVELHPQTGPDRQLLLPLVG